MKPQVKTRHSKATISAFYRHLGKIFYGIAAVDRKVTKEEITKLKQLVRLKWSATEKYTDIHRNNPVYLIETSFDDLVNKKLVIENFIPDFARFVKKHPVLFDSQTNRLILSTIYSIAMAFAGYNKSELVYASRLSFLLKYNSGSVSA